MGRLHFIIFQTTCIKTKHLVKIFLNYHFLKKARVSRFVAFLALTQYPSHSCDLTLLIIIIVTKIKRNTINHHHEGLLAKSHCQKKTVFVICSLWHCIGRPLYAFSQGRTLFNQDTFIKSQTLPSISLILGKLKSGALDVLLCQNWSVQNFQSHTSRYIFKNFFLI